MLQNVTNDLGTQVVARTQKEARRLNHNYVGTEHFLLALLKVDDSIAKIVLREAGVKRKLVTMHVESIVGRGARRIKSKRLPLTPRAQKLLEYSLSQARQLGHDYIGPEHLLLGLVQMARLDHGRDGVATRVLAELGVDPEKLRTSVVQYIVAAYLALAEPGVMRDAMTSDMRLPESLLDLRRQKGADHPEFKLELARHFERTAYRLRKEAKALQAQPADSAQEAAAG